MLTGVMNEGEIEEAGELAYGVEQYARAYRSTLRDRAGFVREMRAAGHTQRELAEALGVTPAVIAKIDRQNERNDHG